MSRQYARGEELSTHDDPDNEDGTIPAQEMARRLTRLTVNSLLHVTLSEWVLHLIHVHGFSI